MAKKRRVGANNRGLDSGGAKRKNVRMSSSGPQLSEIGQIALTVSDVAKALRFYRDVLGLKFLFSAGPNLTFLAAGSTRIMRRT